MNTLNMKSKLHVLAYETFPFLSKPKVNKELQMEYLKEFRQGHILKQAVIVSLLFTIIIASIIIIPSLILLNLIFLASDYPWLIAAAVIVALFVFVSRTVISGIDSAINYHDKFGREK